MASNNAGRNNIWKEELIRKLQDANFPLCPKIEKYEELAKIGQGTFGEVFKARDRETNEVVALKKILMENEKEGFPITAVREINILKKLNHENVVNLIAVSRTTATQFNPRMASFYLVFEFCQHDLAGLLSNGKVKFSLGEIKMVIKQLLNGIFFIHSNKILHRDIKTTNILITKTGTLKIADFGLARPFSEVRSADKPNRFTNGVVTLWYRPPELLLGERNYGTPIDLWGCGCIMAEMWNRRPIFPGKTEQEQLTLIYYVCGSITPETFSGCEKLELWNKLKLVKDRKRQVKDKLKTVVTDPHGLDLIDKLLTIDPAKRINSDAALDHDFFWVDPLPCDLRKVLQPLTQSMFEYLMYKQKVEEQRLRAGPSRPDDGQYMDIVY